MARPNFIDGRHSTQFLKRNVASNQSDYNAMRAAGLKPLQISRDWGVSRRTVYDYEKRLQGMNLAAERRKQEAGPDPKSVEEIRANPESPPELLACLQDTPEGFRAFFNRYAIQEYPKHPELQPHMLEIVRAAWDEDASPDQLVNNIRHAHLSGRPTDKGMWKDQVVITVPPRHGKSQIWSIWFPLWQLVLNRTIRIILLSKTEVLVKGWIIFIANQMESNELLIHDFGRLRPLPGEGEWAPRSAELDVAPLAGQVHMADRNLRGRGAKQQILGMGADLIVADDSTGEDDVSSALERQRTYDWFTGIVYSRRQRQTKIFVIGTRFHIDDLFGMLIRQRWEDDEDNRGEEVLWDHINFPALRDPDSGLPSTALDALPLWPAEWTRRELIKMKNSNIRTFEQMYQQNPAAPEDLWYDYERLLDCRDPERGIGQASWDRTKTYVVRVATWDPGQAQYGVAMLLDVNRENREIFECSILDIVRTKGLGPKQVFEILKDWQAEYGPVNWFIPEKNSFYWVEQDEMALWCRSQNIRMPQRGSGMPSTHTGLNKHSMETGWQSLAGDFGAGRVRLPFSGPTAAHKTGVFIEEARYMPHSATNDQISALALAKRFYQSMHVYNPTVVKVNGGWDSMRNSVSAYWPSRRRQAE